MNYVLASMARESSSMRALTQCSSTDHADATQPLSAVDASLVEAVRAGDSHAAAPLFHRLRPAIERTLKILVRDRPADVDDLVQVTLERVVRGITDRKFEGRSQLTTWARAIAVHVAMDWLRSRHAEQKLYEALFFADPHRQSQIHDVERQLEARAEVRRLQAVLARMKCVNATALVLHDVYRHSVPEVARLLGISVSAAESRVRRARLELVRRGNKLVPTARSSAMLES
jgi:RNA polymerase sigma-70 factor (ECF subfamily)